MKIALDSQEDGVAIAAPQIGVSLRIFVVSEKALDIPDKKEDRKKRVKDPKKVYRVQEARGYQEYRSFVNQYGQIGIERRPKFGLGGDAVETQMPMMVGFRDLSAGATICKVTTYVHNPGEKPIEPVINFEHGLGEIQRVAKGEQTSLQ
jgi:hypothetical protein